MTRVLVLGAGGQIARLAVDMLAQDRNVQQTLFVRDASRLQTPPRDATVIEGDVLDPKALAAAVRAQDVVISGLSGPVDKQAEAIVAAMNTAGVGRLIAVNAAGIYNELPPAFNRWQQRQIGSLLKPFRRAADTIEASGLEYTVLRPGWLTDDDEVDFETTGRHETFRGTIVSRKSVAALVIDLITHPGKGARENLGVNKPGTDGDKPAFI